MTNKQHTYHITFYLSDGKEVSGRIKRDDDVETCLEQLETIIEYKKTIFLSELGVLIQTKYITHVKIMKVGG